MKNETGITLIALVVTIIVLLILSGVSISIIVGNNGILNQAIRAVKETEQASVKEEIELAWSSVEAEYWDELTRDSNLTKEDYDMIEKLNKYVGDKGIVKSIKLEQIEGVSKYYIVIYEQNSNKEEYTVKVELSGKVTEVEKIEPSEGDLPEGVEKISKTQSFVGYYADVNGDKKPDGMIYADLAKGTTRNEEGISDELETSKTYEIPIVDNLKDYYISEYREEDGTVKQVITSMGGSQNDRFYVMDLEELVDGNQEFYWYPNSEDWTDDDVTTKTGFGEGRTNTQNMLNKWKSEYANQEEIGKSEEGSNIPAPPTPLCIWAEIQDEFNDGWFLPSKEEVVAFSEETGRAIGNRQYYWTSSQNDQNTVWVVGYFWEGMNTSTVASNSCCFVHLSTTF